MSNDSQWATPPEHSAAAAPQPAGRNPSGERTDSNWLGITSLVLSLATFVTGVSWIAGIVLGHMGLAAVKRGEASNRSFALAGVVIGWVFAALTLLAIAGFFLFLFAVRSS
ncbi:DUF4190 domain-containing protein [Demequina sp. TTPB684]|uniref:DUF4190 domain-containing protein n=1 Tax=unclassified Demequina TaxID=2620311 RepID=UPI001CF517C5|nr:MULTISPECIES: DUF4190 domain-containing protein [unclassified Demequina]MCB2411392.1 DUF4190 domain-containing protein [Demequina sp. TTPB684]UPU87765.1 DUF4190 domain-containing protein [Demequina sp. TMPB413]